MVIYVCFILNHILFDRKGMAKKSNKKTTGKPVEKKKDIKPIEEQPKEEMSISQKKDNATEITTDYKPGFLSELLSKQTIDSKPAFEIESVLFD